MSALDGTCGHISTALHQGNVIAPDGFVSVNLFLSSKEGHRFFVFGTRKEEVKEDCRKLHSEEFHNLQFSSILLG